MANDVIPLTAADSLVIFDDARRQIDEAKTADQVKRILALATGLAAAARKATDREMEAEAAALKLEAERKLGQLMAAQKATVGLHKGGRPTKTGIPENPVSGKPITLAEAGIDKNLASKARAAAALSETDFKEAVEDKREAILAPPPPPPRTRRSSKEIMLKRADEGACSVYGIISLHLNGEGETYDTAFDYLLTKYLDELVEIARHPKFARIVAAVMAKLGANAPIFDRESEIRLIGLQSENEELRARIAELEATSNSSVNIADLARDCRGLLVHPAQNAAAIQEKLSRIIKLSDPGAAKTNAKLDQKLFRKAMALEGGNDALTRAAS